MSENLSDDISKNTGISFTGIYIFIVYVDMQCCY